MLNEKVTVTICGKAYNLRTDNASSLIRQGEEADRRITEYCREMSLSKDDACVFTVLDLLGDLDSANAQRDSYAKKNAALVSTASVIRITYSHCSHFMPRRLSTAITGSVSAHTSNTLV